ncbi:hypothetical protein QBC47DRAFT_363663 [Echria macrotheca]|uniref:Potassium channel domain-containing protein n=1 Tax=Echria macrotheca TaxID=438768 RepID=A0AAJ0F281_9PEZI|nr:hypothetical protein QBC47DRAFT_363663 [Echria macrotheca]
MNTDTTGTVRIRAGGLIKLRGPSDSLPQQWWFASTAIPLIAATIGPLSNVLSIAALVSPWRVTLPNDGIPDSTGRGSEDAAVGIEDPKWELIFNALSLACGFAGNLLLLLHFTSRVRYIIALPVAILCWLLSSVILIAIETAMAVYVPPQPPLEVYSQGFWHAVLASVLYFIGSTILTINLVGYFRGHYPQRFDLDDDQRTLILQTTSFFFWLAGGSGMFCITEGFTYADALYYADVLSLSTDGYPKSILTIGFGDFAPATDPGRGFLFVFQLVGIVFLGLVISSITKFAANISADRIIKQHQMHARASTVGRAVTSERELRERLGLPPRATTAFEAESKNGEERLRESGQRGSLAQYGRLEIVGRTVTFHPQSGSVKTGEMCAREAAHEKRKRTRQKLLLLQRERDRFEAMRQIQRETRRYKQYWALGMALLAFGLLWCFGAFIFMLTEAQISGLRYFECFYFCFVALLTIGYGDISPKSNLGKPFFIVWSLIAVPIVTLLIQELSRTVVSAVNRGTFALAEWTIMPKRGVASTFISSHPHLHSLLSLFCMFRNPDLSCFSPSPPPDQAAQRPTIETGYKMSEKTSPGKPPEEKGEEEEQEEREEKDLLPHHLAQAIRSVARDLRLPRPRRYTFDEWTHFTRLIRSSSSLPPPLLSPSSPSSSLPTSSSPSSSTTDNSSPSSSSSSSGSSTVEETADRDTTNKEITTWDWIGEDSPLLADTTEAEWILDRLCESLHRYTRQHQSLLTRTHQTTSP